MQKLASAPNSSSPARLGLTAPEPVRMSPPAGVTPTARDFERNRLPNLGARYQPPNNCIKRTAGRSAPPRLWRGGPAAAYAGVGRGAGREPLRR